MRFILQADCIAKGLLALGLVPGEDVVVAVGVPANNSCALFVAGCSVGIGFAVSISRIVQLAKISSHHGDQHNSDSITV